MNPKFINTSQVMGSKRWVAIARLDATLPEAKARVSVEGTGDSEDEAIANVKVLWARLTNYMEMPDGRGAVKDDDRPTVSQDCGSSDLSG